MRFSPSFRYQLHDQRMAIFVYYCVILGMVLLNLLFLPFAGDSDFTVSTNGVTMITAVFTFVLSLCVFKESLLLNLQHGVSRRTQFLAHLGAMGVVCAVMAVADELYTLLLALLSFVLPGRFLANSLYEMFYSLTILGSNNGYTTYAVETTPGTVVCSVVFSFFLLLVFYSFGYLITTLNYRLNKIGKIILWCGWPCLFIAGGIFFDRNPWLVEALVPRLLRLLNLCFSTLPRLCLTCLILTAVFSALAWPLMRRAHAK